MNENENVEIDFSVLMNKIVDKAMAELVSELMPDEKSKKLSLGILAIHRKYGINGLTSIKILQEIAELTKEVDK